MTHQQIIQVKHGPPSNELPAVLDSGAVWSGDGIVMAIPSLLVYTTGAELLILCRTRHTQVRNTEHARTTSDALSRGLRVDGRPVTLLGGEYQDHGFTYRAWAPSGNGQGRAGILRLSLEWPGIDSSEHSITEQKIADAAGRVIVLW